MTIANHDLTMSSSGVERFQTGPANDSDLATRPQTDNEAGWKAIIDTLLRWHALPADLEDPMLEPVRPDLIGSALDYAYDALRTNAQQHVSVPAPDSVAPTVDGTIAFERRDGQFVVQYDVIDIGLIEVTVLDRDSVVQHFLLRRQHPHRGWYLGQSA